MEKSSRRQNNFEVLRMLCMFFVVTGHYIFHGVKEHTELQVFFQFDSFLGGFNWITMEALYVISCVAVNCFVMISGYFLIEKTTIRWGGIGRVWIQTLFYGALLLGLAALAGKNPDLRSGLFGILPIYGRQYWFVGIYLGLMLVAPFLSRLARCLNKRQYLLLLTLLFILNFEFPYGDLFGGAFSLPWFIFLFLLAGYMKLWGVPQIVVRHKGLIFWGVWSLLMIGAVCVCLFRGKGMDLISTDYNGLVFFLSLTVFICFAHTPMEGKFWAGIAKLAPFCFAVYLIHANPLWDGMLWESVIPGEYKIPMLFHCLAFALIIYLVCLLADMLRSLLFKALHIPQLINWIDRKMPNLEPPV